MIGDIVQRKLPVSLDASTVNERAREGMRAAEKVRDAEANLDRYLDEVKDTKKILEGAVEEAKCEVDRLAAIVRTGQEIQDVDCDERAGRRGERIVEIVRRDTDTVVETRAMTPEEIQLSIPETGPRPSPSASIGEKLRALRAQTALSQAQLGGKIGLDKKQIYAIEQGRTKNVEPETVRQWVETCTAAGAEEPDWWAAEESTTAPPH